MSNVNSMPVISPLLPGRHVPLFSFHHIKCRRVLSVLCHIFLLIYIHMNIFKIYRIWKSDINPSLSWSIHLGMLLGLPWIHLTKDILIVLIVSEIGLLRAGPRFTYNTHRWLQHVNQCSSIAEQTNIIFALG